MIWMTVWAIAAGAGLLAAGWACEAQAQVRGDGWLPVDRSRGEGALDPTRSVAASVAASVADAARREAAAQARREARSARDLVRARRAAGLLRPGSILREGTVVRPRRAG